MLQMRQSLFSDHSDTPQSVDFGLSDLESTFEARISKSGISIFGVQDKFAVSINNAELIIGNTGFPQYILKPAPSSSRFQYPEFLPANEHLTMTLAGDVFDISVAASGVVTLSDGISAYITRRFDMPYQGVNLQQEDLAQLSGRIGSEEIKYSGSYLDLGRAIKKHASKDQLEPFFRLVVFNYIICNEDAHWRNFSLYRLTPKSEYILTPAYDLVNTRLHLPNANGYMALDDWLYDGMIDEEPFASLGYPSKQDFIKFGVKMGLGNRRVVAILDEMIEQAKAPLVEQLIGQSQLSDELKERYYQLVHERVKSLAYIPA